MGQTTNQAEQEMAYSGHVKWKGVRKSQQWKVLLRKLSERTFTADSKPELTISLDF
jgi:hypothetical protein